MAFCGHLDNYHRYWHEHLTSNEVKAGWTLLYVVQNVCWNMIFDTICHVNVLQRGWEHFPCKYDGCHDLAGKQRNYFCLPRRIDRSNKYAIERGFQIYGLPKMNDINLQVLRIFDEIIDIPQTMRSTFWLFVSKLNVNTCLKTKGKHLCTCQHRITVIVSSNLLVKTPNLRGAHFVPRHLIFFQW